MTTSKEHGTKDNSLYVHAHQHQQLQPSSSMITTMPDVAAAAAAPTQNNSEIISRHNNSGEQQQQQDLINRMIYPYRCEMSDNLMLEEEHASPPIKYHTKEDHQQSSSSSATMTTAVNSSSTIPFYNGTQAVSSFSASYNTFHSQQLSTSIHSALSTPKNNSSNSSKNIIFANNLQTDINNTTASITPMTTTSPAGLVDSNGRPIITATTTTIDFTTRPYKKYKNLTIVDNEDYSNGDLSQQQQSSAHELPKRYICAVCGKKFVRPSSLTTHTYSHTGEKPYKCAICGRQFSVISNLRRHGKVHSTNSNLSASPPTMN